ncbi:MAG: YbhB/YbcL family Raf kinase inhibitor-like protein [Bryobacterales bacterium]|nr:YbhB/YbcL family Raf kinase inhibitor-like protein [Bryobacterales bacterium]MBV9397172.1 YbhB/YbcL family Raf kinase inhibitor-like protein [Bryobacterales bacterium]
MRNAKQIAALALALAVGMGIVSAQDKGGKGGKKGGGGIPAPLSLTVTGYADGATIPAKLGCSGGNQNAGSPAISWSGAPAGTMAFAVILHDTDVALPTGEDVLHWAIFDIPGTVTGLPENVAKTATLPDGSVQINNIAGMPGYMGPCPPPPTTHHYIFEVYALDQKLGLPASTSRADLLNAMKGHIRAKGTYVGTYKQ